MPSDGSAIEIEGRIKGVGATKTQVDSTLNH
jgi:hypothetical protein